MIEERNAGEHINDECDFCHNGASYLLDNSKVLQKMFVEPAIKSVWEAMDSEEQDFWTLLYLKAIKPDIVCSVIEDTEKLIGEENVAVKRLLTAIKQEKVSGENIGRLFVLRLMAPDKYIEIIDKWVQKALKVGDGE